MKNILVLFLIVFSFKPILAQETDGVRGLAIGVPGKEDVPRFVRFMDEELGPRGINVLVLRVDYNYEYKSQPKLVNNGALSQKEVDLLVAAAKRNKIKIIPQINLLGHQSWHSDLEKLLEVYPEFDETPHIVLPEKYEWPNEDGLYCKSYCPLHPEVHNVVFQLVDEITEAFKADAFHAGLDEVFYIGDDKCPRCSGRDKAELFAGEVASIRNHLALSGKKLWMWGDRLIDGKTTGIGMWEASMNNTHRAVDLIPKDVVICDWHYERADPTAAYFALKGFDVVTCPWRIPSVSLQQKSLLEALIKGATKETKPRYKGMMHTVWSSAGGFLDRFDKVPENPELSDVATFKAIFPTKKL